MMCGKEGKRKRTAQGGNRTWLKKKQIEHGG